MFLVCTLTKLEAITEYLIPKNEQKTCRMVSIHTRSHQLNSDGHKTAHGDVKLLYVIFWNINVFFSPPPRGLVFTCDRVIYTAGCVTVQGLPLVEGIGRLRNGHVLRNVEVAAWWRLMEAVLQY